MSGIDDSIDLAHGQSAERLRGEDGRQGALAAALAHRLRAQWDVRVPPWVSSTPKVASFTAAQQLPGKRAPSVLHHALANALSQFQSCQHADRATGLWLIVGTRY